MAYKQPISRAQVAAIRGVNVDGVMRTLQQRGYIDEVGRDVGPGQAALFGTTQLFLERLGLNSLDELPSLGDFIPEAEVVELLEHGLRIDDSDGDGGDAGGAGVAAVVALLVAGRGSVAPAATTGGRRPVQRRRAPLEPRRRPHP